MLKRISLLIILNLLVGVRIYASHEKGSSRLDLKNYSGANNMVFLQDNKVNTVNAFVNFATPMGFFDYTYKNRLILGIDKSIKSIGSASASLLPANKDYSAEVIVTLTYNKLVGNNYVNINVPCTLSINYKGEITNLNNVNNGVKETDLDVFTFTSGYQALAIINSVVIKNGSNVVVTPTILPENLYLELQCDAERYYDMATNAAPFNNNLNEVFIRYYSDVTTGNQIEINWTRIPGAEEYDVEWVWLDEYTYAYTDPNNINQVANPFWNANINRELDFRNNSTRIRTDQNSYKVSNTFESGYLFFRIRGVGKTLAPTALTTLGNDPLLEFYTPWSWDDKTTLPQLVSSFSQPSSINSIGAPVISNIAIGGGIITFPPSANVPVFIALKNVPGGIMNLEANKNWVYKSTYAEEGKKKEVVSFFDGSQRNRQTVTINNSANTAVVGESYYDFLGRGALQALPTPVKDATIKFYQTTVNGKNGFNFENVPSNQRPITKDVFGLGVAPGLCSNVLGLAGFSSLYGTGQYYSTNNLFINTTNKLETSYTPNSDNFPFTQTEFIADNTSKVARQSGVGETFKIQNQLLVDKHDTRYMYGVPDQEELDRLFGSESGYANRYTKNVTIDANGQTSLSYLNENGKVIATALTGTAPSNMIPLKNSSGLDLTATGGLITVDQLNKANPSDVDTPKDNNNQVADALIFNKKILVTSAQTYSFDYQLSGPTFTGCNAICYDCVYDLTFDITDKCGNRPVGLTAPIVLTLGKIVTQINTYEADTVCGDDLVNFTFQQLSPINTPSLLVALEVGEYSISKKLTVNKDALTSYLNIYMRNCAKKLSDFQAAENANLDVSGCNMTCEGCVLALGTMSDYINSNAAILNTPTLLEITKLTAEFNGLVATCREPCRYTSYCDAAFETMLVDMSPGGQYADFEGPNNTFDPSQYPLSIYNFANALSKKSLTNAPPNWKEPSHYITGNTEYYEEDDVTPSEVQVTLVSPGVYQPAIQIGVTPTLVAGNLYTVRAKELANGADFIAAWKASWSRSLVKYHPEYCYFEWCRKNSTQTGNPITVTPVKLDPNGEVFIPVTPLPFAAVTITTSEQFDSLLVTIDDINTLDFTSGSQQAALDVLTNDPYWTSTGVYYVADGGFGPLPYSNLPNPALNTYPGSGYTIDQRRSLFSANPVDFSVLPGIPGPLHFPDKFNYKTANNRFWNFKGLGLNIYQYAAIISSTLVAQIGQPVVSLLTQLNSNFSLYGGNYPTPNSGAPYILNMSYTTQAEKEQKRKTWQTFVTLYLGLKQELQQEAAESFVMNTDCRGCNDCIGKPNFDPESVPFTTYSNINMGQYNGIGGILNPFVNQVNVFLLYLQNWYLPILPNNLPQQCGLATVDLYKNKIKRFQTANDAKNLEPGNGGNVLANIYATTGLCPNAYYLQNFLKGMVDPNSGNSLLVNTNLSANVPEFTNELYKEVTGGVVPGVFTPAFYNVVSATNQTLTANISINPFTPCPLTLTFSGPPLPIKDWANYPSTYTITNFTNLQATGVNAFSVMAQVKLVASPFTQFTVALDGTTCFSLTGCSFPPPCKLNGNGNALKSLFNSLVTNGQFNSVSPVTIGGPSPAIGSPHNAVFTNGLKPFLEITGVPGTWTWTKITPYVFDVTDGSPGNNKIRVTFNNIVPAVGFNLSCINSFQNFQVDPSNPGGFIMDAVSNYPIGNLNGCANATFAITGNVSYGTDLTQPLTGLNIGNCNFEYSTCNSREHDLKKDMEAFVNDNNFSNILIAPSQNLTNNPLLTLLMRSYIGTSVNINGSPNMNVPQNYYHWVLGTTTATEVTGWFVQTNNIVAPPNNALPANACKFSLKHKNPPNGPSFPNVFALMPNSFSLVTSPLINNSAYRFLVITLAGDTLIGETSCLPMRQCDTYTCAIPAPAGMAATYTIQNFDCTTLYTLNDIPSYFGPYDFYTPIPSGPSYNCTNINSISLNPYESVQYTGAPATSTIQFNYPVISSPGGPLCGGGNSYSFQPSVISGSNVLLFNSLSSAGSVNTFSTYCYNLTPTDNVVNSNYQQSFSVPQNGSYNISFNFMGKSITTGTPIPGTYPPIGTLFTFGIAVYIDNILVLSNQNLPLNSLNLISTNQIPLNNNVNHSLKIVFTKNNGFHLGNELYQIKLNKIGGEINQIPCVNSAWPQDTMPSVEYEEPCIPYLEDIVDNAAQVKYDKYTDSLKAAFIRNYTKHCMSNAIENLYMQYNNNDYHYTLYYYDQAGNLVRTVPPEGVKVINSPAALAQIKVERNTYPVPKTIFSDHKLYTTYTYNSLNQLVKQETPDAGISLFYYDLLGRLVLSQNAEQYAQSTVGGTNLYSYTRYEPLGRIAEVGQISTTDVLSLGAGLSAALSNANFPISISSPGALRTEVTSTYYGDDQNFSPIILPVNFSNGFQQNLRTRVASVTLEDNYDGNNLTYNHATHYTYDVHGNVKELIQDNPSFNGIFFGAHRYKNTQYEYDLISGKVNSVVYQNGKKDMMAHEYLYDAENRITNVFTSRNGYNWDQDAKYYYYLHGPLARTEIGQHKVQGMDYAYTLQGWIKGVNSNIVAADNDQGKDGVVGLNNTNTNNYIHTFNARDAYGYNLNYYATDLVEDYTPVNNSIYANQPNYFLAKLPTPPSPYPQLFNGNISTMGTAYLNIDPTLVTIPNTGVPISKYQNYSQLKMFAYDQLNRIKSAAATSNYIPALNSWLPVTGNTAQYLETFVYDENGNIMNANRNNANVTIDKLQYFYYTKLGGVYSPNSLSPNNATNKLAYVTDVIGAPIGGDIGTQSLNNYSYDAIGNLRSDAAEQIAQIDWTVYGKIKRITRTVGSTKKNLEFNYDSQGNRISKRVYISGSLGVVDYQTTYYARDAQGNLLATYEKDFQTSAPAINLKLQELEMYGSSRLGNIGVDELLVTTSGAGPLIANVPVTKRELGDKNYELSNHLGNVLTVITDRKIPIDLAGDGTIDFFMSDLLQTTDYYAFGSVMQGRNYQTSSNFRFGFNGKENDNEVKGNGNSLDFGERIYDSRLGRWLTPDPQKQFRLSPYLSFANNPILFTDPDGGWIPGVDDNGRITLTAEKGDNIKTLYSFFGDKQNASKYLPTVWTGKSASKMEITNGTQVTFNSGNNYSKAMKDVKENPKKYEVSDNDEKNQSHENYNCHTAAICGSKGQEFHNGKPMDDTGERNPTLKSDYDNVTSQEAKFGESVITFGDAHSAVFFGKSSDGTSYAFSKQGNNTAPVIVPVTDLVKGNGESPQGNIGNGLVGNPSNFAGKTSYAAGSSKVTKTGQAAGAGGSGIKTSNGTGYFNPKKK